MTKLSAPLLSLGAHGTIGGSLTFRESRSGPQAIQVPRHSDRQSLPQLYQRWRYYDACQYWHSLTPSAQEAYRAIGRPRRLTAFQACIRAYLTSPLDLALWLRLDELQGSTASDSGPYNLDGIINGPSRTQGQISYARSWDGIDDLITTPTLANIPSLQSQGTIAAWFNTNQWRLNETPIFRAIFRLGTSDSGITLQGNPDINMILYGAAPGIYLNFGSLITPPQAWHHLAIKWASATISLYIDGTFTYAQEYTAAALVIGTLELGQCDGLRKYTGDIDDFRIYNRALSAEHIATIAQIELPATWRESH